MVRAVTVHGTFVVIGAGLAGAKAVEALRDQGFEGRLVLIGAEPHRPYERPPLSKGYLAGTAEREKSFVHPEGWYAEHDVEFKPGRTAIRLDRAARRVELNDGTTVDFDKVLITTGASPRRLGIPGADAPGVHYLRTIDDSELLREVIAKASRLVVIGAGWIGLEVTATARQAGVEVTVVENAGLPLLRVLGPEVAQVFSDLHRAHGVDLRVNDAVAEITTEAGRVNGVILADGSHLPADAVVVGIGIVPNAQLAEAAGLAVHNGIQVNASLRTDDPNVFAAGDVASAEHPLLGRRIRVEHWANALKQPVFAATAMLGREATYSDLPYFFSDQYDLGMEYVGYAEPGEYDEVVFRGDVPGREFIAFWLKDSRVLAGMNVNVWDVTDPIKALIRSGATIDRARLADPNVPLTDLI
jgi:3-phenylpropionate/trans-cinnamate dioxygenase ferredoxin reductase subunit